MTVVLVRRRSPVARSPVPLVVAGFALLTALVLAQIGGAAMALRPNATSIASDPTAAATRSAVDRFYAAVNLVLATGDAVPLDAATDPAFIDHGSVSRMGDRVGLIAELLARRRIDPDLRFDVAAVIVDGDRALAYLQTDPFDATGAGPSTTIDAVWVHGGVVVERWSDDLGTATAVPTPESEPGSDDLGTKAVRPLATAELWSGDGRSAQPAALATVVVAARLS
jgi:hypothetical protein